MDASMWNSFVSIGNSLVSRLIVSFVDALWRYPIVTSVFLLSFAILTVLFCVELFKDEKRSR